MKTQLFLLFFVFQSLIQLLATNFNVTNSNDSGAGSFRQAITDANANNTATALTPHTITINGVYTITLLTAITTLNNHVIINASGSNVLTIVAPSTFRCLNIGSSKTVVLNYVVLKGTLATAPAALGIGSASNVTLNNCAVQYNAADYAIDSYGNLTCNNCIFNNNTSATGKSMIYAHEAGRTFIFSNCIIENNTNSPAIKVPAWSSGNTILNITNCIIRNNKGEVSGSNYGAGISSAGITTITNTEISGNKATRGAGLRLEPGNAIYKSKLKMVNCTMSADTASVYYGGAIWVQYNAATVTDSVTLTNCTFSGNVATTNGGGLFLDALTTYTLNNCTVTGNKSNGNTSTSQGGGLVLGNGTLMLNYCIVAGNNPASTHASRDIVITGGTPVRLAGSTTGNNLYGGTVTFALPGAVTTGNVVFSGSISTVLNPFLLENFSCSPLLPDGKRVKTHALVLGGQAVDPNPSNSGCQVYDQRGFLRDNKPDIGSFEVRVVTAASTSFTDVQNAVNISVPGDIVQIPEGYSDWGTNTLNVPGGIYIKGSGYLSTIIQRSNTTSNYLIQFDGSNGSPCLLSDIKFEGVYNNDNIYSKGVGLLNGCINFKVFNCEFYGFANCALQVGNALNQRGVIYSNRFINNYYSSIGNYGYGIVVLGNGTWPALELGSENAVFVEDNYFSGNRHNIASNNGSRYVFRYNNVIGTTAVKNFAMTDAHGLSSWPRGSRSFEIYNNEYSTDFQEGFQRTAIGIRGGDGVIFNNTCTNKIARTIELSIEGFTCGTYPGSDQIRSLYIWNNEAHDELGYGTIDGVANNCPSSIALNRDYFMTTKSGYSPYSYPHPLRSPNSKTMYVSKNTTNTQDLDVNHSPVKVYLNSTNNFITIEGEVDIEKVFVYNAQGKTVLSSYSSTKTINIESWINGLYIIRVFANNKWFCYKILK